MPSGRRTIGGAGMPGDPLEQNVDDMDAKAAAEWAKANLEKKDPYYVEHLDKTDGLIMSDGNTAGALGAIYGGVQFAAGGFPFRTWYSAFHIAEDCRVERGAAPQAAAKGLVKQPAVEH